MIFRVFPENIARLWPQVSPLFAPLLAERPTYSDEDARLLCMGGAGQLWVQWQEPTVEAAIVTEFATYPRGCWVRIWLDGARKDCRQDHHGFLSELEKWRDVNGCRGFECIGRAGWAKLFPQAKLEGIMLRWTER